MHIVLYIIILLVMPFVLEYKIMKINEKKKRTDDVFDIKTQEKE